MKTITSTVLALALGIVSVYADDVTLQSYVSASQAVTEANFPTSSTHVVQIHESAASTTTMISSAFVFTLPSGTEWAKFDTIMTGAEGIFNGTPTILVPPVSMMMSQWNTTTSPNIYARNSLGVIPKTGQIGATNIESNPTHILITARNLELGRTTSPPYFPKMSIVGDRFKVWQSANITWFDGSGQHSKYVESEAIVEIVPDSTKINKFATPNIVLGGDNRHYITVVGLVDGINWSEYGTKWWMQRSVDLVNWIPEPDASFINSGPNYVVVGIPKTSDKMFFRVGNP